MSNVGIYERAPCEISTTLNIFDKYGTLYDVIRYIILFKKDIAILGGSTITILVICYSRVVHSRTGSMKNGYGAAVHS